MVVISSLIIHGNDPAVFRMMGDLIRQGVEVRIRITDDDVHVSGHAHRDEQRRMIELLQPRCFMPVHGTLHHLKRHADFARELGIPNVILAENGDVVEVSHASMRKVDVVEVGKIATWDGEEVSEDVLREREALGRTGIAIVTLAVDVRGRLLGPPFISTRGVVTEGDDVGILRSAAMDLVQTMDARPFTQERPTDDNISDLAQRVLRRSFDGFSSRRPVAVVHVVRR
jgi:ribonuclease J